MSIWQFISKWFLKNAWPQIQQLLKRAIGEIIGWLIKRLKKIFDDFDRKKEEKAKARAEEYDRKAKETDSEKEAEENRIRAEVWRQVAEELRQVNEEKDKIIKDLEAELKQKAEEIVEGKKVEDVFAAEKGTIELLPGKFLALPQSDEKD